MSKNFFELMKDPEWRDSFWTQTKLDQRTNCLLWTGKEGGHRPAVQIGNLTRPARICLVELVQDAPMKPTDLPIVEICKGGAFCMEPSHLRLAGGLRTLVDRRKG